MRNLLQYYMNPLRSPEGGEGGAAGGGGGQGGGEATGTTTPPAAPSAPWGGIDDQWNVGEGDQAKPWYTAIPEDSVRQTMEAKAYKNPAQLAMAYANLLKLQNGNDSVIAVPGDNATPEQVAAFNKKIGVPDAPDAYDFGFGQDAKVDEATTTFGKNMLHKLGVPASKAKVAGEMWNQFVQDQQRAVAEQQQTQNTAALAALEQEWGADLQANKAAGQRALAALKLDDATVQAIENNIGAAGIVKLLAAIGRASDEGGFVGGNQGGDPNSPESMSKEAAQAKIKALQGDADFQKAYTDKNHPQHEEKVQYMMRLFARA